MSETQNMIVDDVLVINTDEQVKIAKPQENTQVPLCVLVPEDSPILKEVMPEYDFNNQQIGSFRTAEELASSMVETCKRMNGYGLSANQVGIKTRMFVMGAADEYVAFFNPKITAYSDETVHLVEGCLSFPLLGVYITRPTHIEVEYQDYNGNVRTAKYSGMSARCFQHELDHMNGVLYTKRAKPIALQQALKKREKIKKLIKKIDNGNSNRIR